MSDLTSIIQSLNTSAAKASQYTELLKQVAAGDKDTVVDIDGELIPTLSRIADLTLQALNDLQYQNLGDYAGGIEITNFGQVVRESGEFYRLKADQALPHTTTGTWIGDDENRFVSVGDGVLRADLAAAGGIKIIGNGAVQIDSLKGPDGLGGPTSLIDATWPVVGMKVRTLGYRTPGDGGGNDYEIGTGFGTDDGGAVIDLTGSGLQAKGLFVSGIVKVRQFGAFDKTNFDLAFTKSADHAYSIRAPLGIFGDFTSSGGAKINNPITIFSDAVITCDNSSSGVALEIGSALTAFNSTASKDRLILEGKLSIFKERVSGDPYWWTDTGDTSIGVLAHNVSEGIFPAIIDGFAENMVCSSDHVSGFVRNDFKNGSYTNGKKNLNLLVVDPGYVNENKWDGGSISNSTSTPVGVQSFISSIDMSNSGATFKCNGNNFYNIAMENSVADVSIITDGFNNSWRECRMEGVKPGSIKLEPSSHSNHFSDNFGAEYLQAAYDDQSTNGNIYSGSGIQRNISNSSFGVYTGRNNTVASGGGPAKYPVFYANSGSNRRFAAGPNGTFHFKDSQQSFPAIWEDPVTGRLYLCFGAADPSSTTQHMRGSSDNETIIMGGKFDVESGLRVRSLPQYADNAAAVSGGLVFGEMYEVSGTNPRQVAIVF